MGNGPTAASEIAAPRQPPLVLAFGDSLYAGYGVPAARSFPAALQQALAARGLTAEVINAGVSGETTSGGLRRLGPTLARLKRTPDLVLLGLGANDVFQLFDPAVTRRNLETMIIELKRRGIPVMLTGITAPQGFQHPYFTRFEVVFADLARLHDVAFEPSFLAGVSTDRAMLLPDGIHPNAAGIARMADRVAPQVAAMIEQEGTSVSTLPR
ncbi:arylesterase [Sphingomonas piscis]|uniref:Arylesterase n=2 Tax=Sphingomonas piscis TaxID=2714943 RepID=A0A6G7YTL7_9SPHN|nr:arylesterase [Sphingomonas piscis]